MHRTATEWRERYGAIWRDVYSIPFLLTHPNFSFFTVTDLTAWTEANPSVRGHLLAVALDPADSTTGDCLLDLFGTDAGATMAAVLFLNTAIAAAAALIVTDGRVELLGPVGCEPKEPVNLDRFTELDRGCVLERTYEALEAIGAAIDGLDLLDLAEEDDDELAELEDALEQIDWLITLKDII